MKTDEPGPLWGAKKHFEKRGRGQKRKFKGWQPIENEQKRNLWTYYSATNEDVKKPQY